MPEVIQLSAQRRTDSHWLLRGRFFLEAADRAIFQFTGASWFELFLDGEFLSEGPARFSPALPEYEEYELKLESGAHVFAVHLHDENITTRLLSASVPGFFWACLKTLDDAPIPISWKLAIHPGYRATGRRVGCVLGWSEWCDTRKLASDWWRGKLDDSDWESPRTVSYGNDSFPRQRLGNMRYFEHSLDLLGEGQLVPMSMYDHDPPMSFIARELTENGLPANGCWWRFDLGRVMLGRPVVEVSVPRGALVQVAYAESLTHGRVFPYLKSGSGTDSCPMDTWIARGGTQRFKPLHPKGARYFEVHVLAEPEQIKWEQGCFQERCYYKAAPEGHLETGDALLDRIWRVGVDTLRSCSEDAITDNPYRERGQWLGDAVGPGMDILSVAYSDWRPLVRGLRQAAQCAREDGLIPAVFPGTREYLPSFSIQWISAIPHYYRLTGDKALLKELYPAAVRNLEVFRPYRIAGGLRRNAEWWNFVDWGYSGSASVFQDDVASNECTDPALSFFYLKALGQLAGWAQMIGRLDEAVCYRQQESELCLEMRDGFAAGFEDALGYHAASLALREGLFEGEARARCVAFLKRHMLSCFPNDQQAPRLADNRVESSRLITPFFMHFSLPALIEAGEMDFVLEQIRTCWGWMLDLGVTTWLEVFDPRWSHCHQWSGCPTWILSRYLLGLHTRFDRGELHFDWCFEPGSLESARGRIPLPSNSGTESGAIGVAWEKEAPGCYRVQMESHVPFVLNIGGQDESFSEGEIAFSCRRGLKGIWELERDVPHAGIK